MRIAGAGEVTPGPSGAVPGGGDSTESEAAAFLPLRDFPLKQSRDETLRHAFDNMRLIDGNLLEPGRILSYPYFAVIRDRLYHVTQDAQTKEDITQLLIPKGRREMLFQAAHYNPMAGHLGQDKTLNCLMAHSYWPGMSAGGVWHVANVSWLIHRPSQKRHCALCR